MKFPLKKGRYELSPLMSLLAAVLLTGFYTVLCLCLQPGSYFAVSGVQLLQLPVLLVLNALPIGLTLLAAAFLLRNVFWAAALTGTLWSALSIANRIKIECRDEPVFPRDFYLLKEVGSAVSDYDIQWPWVHIAIILLCAAALVAAGHCIKCRLPKLRGVKESVLRVGGAAVSVLILVLLVLTVYASNSLYTLFRVSNDYYVPSVFNEMGFPYCFCHHFTTYLVERPAGYDRREAEAWDSAKPTSDTENKDVHVIMVMNEAFSDLTDWEGFTYTEANDPLAAFHTLQKSGSAFSGHIVVPNFAAGTANTEFDVLTGMQTQFIGAGTTSAMRTVNRNLDSLHRLFRADGYDTSYVHPGDDWFYNRENVLRWFGAEETQFVDEMTDLDYKGRWVTDVSLVELIRQRFADSVSNGKKVFSYITTIQNHMSYTKDKYGEGYSYPPVETSLSLSDDVASLLSVYIEGVRDADAMLGLLADTFAASDEPVVLVFFGDHLPYLGDNRIGYQELGSDAALAEEQAGNRYAAYEAPYLVWANEAAAQKLDWEQAVAALDLPDDNRISSSFFGQLILELTGRTDDSPWFSYLGQLRRELPVVQPAACLTANGDTILRAALSDHQQQLISKMHRWSYYKLTQKELAP